MEHCASTTRCKGTRLAASPADMTVVLAAGSDAAKEGCDAVMGTTMSLCCKYRADRQGSGCRGRRIRLPGLVSGRNADSRVVSVRQTWVYFVSEDSGNGNRSREPPEAIRSA